MSTFRNCSLASPWFRRGVWALIVLHATVGCGSPPPDSTDEGGAYPALFVDITSEAGLSDFHHERGAAGNLWFPEINGAGVAFIDFDGDEWPDILLAGGGVWDGSGMDPVPAVRLFRNEGNGRFSEHTSQAGLADVRLVSYGFAVGDYDNDGDEDFYLTAVGRNRLFRNEGGRFVDVTAESGTGGPPEWSNSAAFIDADRDGLLDLFVTNYVNWSPENDLPCVYGAENRKDYCTPHAYRGLPPRFYHNQGNGRFVERTEASGFRHSPGKSMGVVTLDYNRDGWPDLAIANDGEPDQLFRNNGDGTFSDVGLRTGMALNSRGQPQAGMGIDAGPIDGSGEDAIVIGNFSNETTGLFTYDGTSFFSDRARPSGITRASLRSLTFGILLLDVDLDGDNDILAVNGHISLFADDDDDEIGVRQPLNLFVNDGTGAFNDVARDVPALAEPRLARGAAYADIDRDGDLDVLITENGGPVHLLRNEIRTTGSGGPDYIRIRLQGTRSNRSAIGAAIALYTGETALRHYVRGASSYLSQSERTATFGLHPHDRVDSVVVEWPSGVRQVITNLEMNADNLLLEPADPEPVDAPS